MAETKKAARKKKPKTELALVEETVPAIVQAVTPMQMLSIAVEQGHDLDKIEKLMELERTYKADIAREAYYQALSDFKKQPIEVTKDKVNAQYQSRYTTIGNLVNTVNAAMAPFGLNARWSIDQTTGIKVTCILSHTLGHSEEVSMSGPPDDSGKKNQLQQIKSTITYLESSTFQAVTGVVSQDANIDDDAVGAAETISPEQLADLNAMINEVDANRTQFLRYCGIEQLQDMLASDFTRAVTSLERKRKQAE